MPEGMSFPVGSVLPEIVLLAGSVLVLIVALSAPERRQQWAGGIALAVVVAAAVATAPMLRGDQGLTFTGTYAADDAAVWSKLIVLGITAAVIGLSLEWFRPDPRRGELYTLLLMSALGAAVLAAAADLLELLLGVLLSSATGYVLAAYHRRAAHSVESGIKYYLIGALTNAAMLYGVVLFFGVASTTTFVDAIQPLRDADPIVLIAAVGLLVVGLAFKLGAVPAHAWVPDVAQGAPAPMAAFLTTAPKVGALVALGRLALILPEAAGWRPAVALVAAATMTLGNLACLWQDDLRRLLGWSAVSQAGYGLMAVVALGRSDLAVASLLFFLVAYALANLAAFGVVVELRGRTSLEEYRGLARARPLLAASLAVAFLSFIGIPPLGGFAAKLLLFGAVIDAGYGWLAVVAVLNTVVSVFYYLRVLGPAYHAPLAGPVPVLVSSAATATVVSAAAVVVVGLAAEPLLHAFELARLLPG